MDSNSKYFDSLGLPVTLNGDGGDSAAEAGTLFALDPIGTSIDFVSYLRYGEPVRHPDPSRLPWYSRPGRFSRDQLIAYLSGKIILSLHNEHTWPSTGMLYDMHKKRKFLTAWNTVPNWVADDTPTKMPDFTLFDVWGLWIRAYPKWWKYPILCLLDIDPLINSIIWHFRKDRVTRNHLLILHVGRKVMPTPIMWLARLITPTTKLIDRWQAHCIATESIDTSDLFRKAFGV